MEAQKKSLRRKKTMMAKTADNSSSLKGLSESETERRNSTVRMGTKMGEDFTNNN
jgi:hypothetical protein